MPLLVEIGLTDLAKSRGTRAPPGPPLATGLISIKYFTYYVVLTTVSPKVFKVS